MSILHDGTMLEIIMSKKVVAGTFFCPHLQKSAVIYRDHKRSVTGIQMAKGIDEAAAIAVSCEFESGGPANCGCEVRLLVENAGNLRWIENSLANREPKSRR
jgi:hypothetical protein